MAAKILDGKALAARIRGGLAEEAKTLSAKGVQPGLAVVLVGEDPASKVYVGGKTKACPRSASARSITTCPPPLRKASCWPSSPISTAPRRRRHPGPATAARRHRFPPRAAGG